MPSTAAPPILIRAGEAMPVWPISLTLGSRPACFSWIARLAVTGAVVKNSTHSGLAATTRVLIAEKSESACLTPALSKNFTPRFSAYSRNTRASTT